MRLDFTLIRRIYQIMRPDAAKKGKRKYPRMAFQQISARKGDESGQAAKQVYNSMK